MISAKERRRVVRIKRLPRGDGGWREAKWSQLRPGDLCAFTFDDQSTLYDCYRPPRKRNESPIQYYRRHKCVDDHYTRRHRGWYYCNPAHCSHRWRSKAERDEHLRRAYGALG